VGASCWLQPQPYYRTACHGRQPAVKDGGFQTGPLPQWGGVEGPVNSSEPKPACGARA
jgi:hypothetical protein